MPYLAEIFLPDVLAKVLYSNTDKMAHEFLVIANREARLNVKNLENFQEALICQYRDLIHEAILESETDHKTRLNIGKLNSKLKVICKAAQYDGLEQTTIDQLIDEAIPASGLKAA